LRHAAISKALPSVIAVDGTYDLAKVLETVTFHTILLPAFHETNVNLSGRLLSVLDRPIDFFNWSYFSPDESTINDVFNIMSVLQSFQHFVYKTARACHDSQLRYYKYKHVKH
jgi:hypothetical protein